MLLRCALLAGLALVVGCSGEAPVDVDPAVDARDETSTDDDTGALTDTGSPSDSASEDVTIDAADAAPTCADSEQEPNNSVPSAVPLRATEITDCDNQGGTFKGVVAGGTDVDFFHYHGKDTALCRTDVTASTKSPGVRLCAFVVCYKGTTEIKSCPKGTPATAPGGVNGCCADANGDVEVEHTCPLIGADDTADVYMRLDAEGATACMPYEVSYHF
jgi:hypothetical protein